MNETLDALDDARCEVERLSGLLEERTQRLCDLEELLALMLDLVDEIVVAVGAGLVVEAVSRAAEIALGASAERLVGRRLPDLRRRSDGAPLVDAMCAAAMAVRHADPSASEARREDGMWIVRSARCSPPANGWLLLTATRRA